MDQVNQTNPETTNESSPSEQSSLSLPWWVEITTQTPYCLYYFGPFDSPEEAVTHQDGYIEDLREEGATEIKVKIIQAQPTILTQEID